MWNHFYKAKELRYEIVDHDTGETICQLPVSPIRAKYEIDANLIAAAPELFFEIQNLIDFIDHESMKDNDEWKEKSARAKYLIKEVTTSKLRRPSNVRISPERIHQERVSRKSESSSLLGDDRCFTDSKNQTGLCNDKRTDGEVYHNESGIDSDEFTKGRATEELGTNVSGWEF